jgi:hypothetical protein
MFPKQRPAKALVCSSSIGCNAVSATYPVCPMRAKRQRISDFEARSVALFATLAVGAALACHAFAAHALTALPAPPSMTPSAATVPAAAQKAQLSPVSGATITPRWVAEQIDDAFRRADSDADGRLSRQEAGLWTGLARGFDQIDSDRDGSISSAEFHESLK